MKKLTVVMPAFNEIDTLTLMLDGWVKYCEDRKWDIIIVNDGSNDNSKAFLNKYRRSSALRIFHHKLNRGYGAAIKTGIKNTKSEYIITVDADGQHELDTARKLLDYIQVEDADLVIGSRINSFWELNVRSIGKSMIRALSRIVVPNKIKDLNSGMKIYRVDLAQRFIPYCPNSMAFSDIITLIFLSEKCLVRELPIEIKKRQAGKSTINLQSAIDTIFEVINIVMFFNPLRLFMPITVIFFIAGLAWGIPLIIQNRGLSVGSLFALIVSIISLLLGLIAEQLSQIRKMGFRE